MFTSHGPDLYGTEPASFYLLNGLLNFNVAFPAALAVIPLQLLLSCLLRREPLTEPRHPLLLTQVSSKKRPSRVPPRRIGTCSPSTHSVMCIVCAMWAISLAGCVLEPASQGGAFPLPLLPTQSCVLVCSVGYISGWLCSGASPTRRSSSSSPPTHSVCVLCVQCGLYLWRAVFWSQPHKDEQFLFPSY